MDDVVKCMIYEYLFRCLDDETNNIRSLDNRISSSPFPAAASDYVDYAFAIARKQHVEDLVRGVSLIIGQYDNATKQ